MALQAKKKSKKVGYPAGGAQGGDVLSQVDSYIEGRPSTGGVELGDITQAIGSLFNKKDSVNTGPQNNETTAQIKGTSESTGNADAAMSGQNINPHKKNGFIDQVLALVKGIF